MERKPPRVSHAGVRCLPALVSVVLTVQVCTPPRPDARPLLYLAATVTQASMTCHNAPHHTVSRGCSLSPCHLSPTPSVLLNCRSHTWSALALKFLESRGCQSRSYSRHAPTCWVLCAVFQVHVLSRVTCVKATAGCFPHSPEFSGSRACTFHRHPS